MIRKKNNQLFVIEDYSLYSAVYSGLFLLQNLVFNLDNET